MGKLDGHMAIASKENQELIYLGRGGKKERKRQKVVSLAC